MMRRRLVENRPVIVRGQPTDYKLAFIPLNFAVLNVEIFQLKFTMLYALICTSLCVMKTAQTWCNLILIIYR